MREYQRAAVKRRRAEWFKGKRCCACGAVDRLEIHHALLGADGYPVWGQSRIWSWSPAALEDEASRCLVLCHECHLEQHRRWSALQSAAGRQRRRRLTDGQVREIRAAPSGTTRRALAEKYGVRPATISAVIQGRSHKEI